MDLPPAQHTTLLLNLQLHIRQWVPQLPSKYLIQRFKVPHPTFRESGKIPIPILFTRHNLRIFSWVDHVVIKPSTLRPLRSPVRLIS
jgi:hypothetical protein